MDFVLRFYLGFRLGVLTGMVLFALLRSGGEQNMARETDEVLGRAGAVPFFV
jgi:hypothetical protein